MSLNNKYFFIESKDIDSQSIFDAKFFETPCMSYIVLWYALFCNYAFHVIFFIIYLLINQTFIIIILKLVFILLCDATTTSVSLLHYPNWCQYNLHCRAQGVNRFIATSLSFCKQTLPFISITQYMYILLSFNLSQACVELVALDLWKVPCHLLFTLVQATDPTVCSITHLHQIQPGSLNTIVKPIE